MSNTVVSDDVLLQILDRDPELIYFELQSRECSFDAIAVLLTYGLDLPAGREWGSRDRRRQWLASERAKRIRQNVARLVPVQISTKSDLRRLERALGKRRGRGKLVRKILKECFERIRTTDASLV